EVTSGQFAPVDFGSILSSSVGRLTLRVRNQGTADLLIPQVIVPAGFILVNGLPTTLAPETSDDLIIGVDTSAPGAKAGILTINSKDPTDPVWQVNLTAKVVFAVAVGSGGSEFGQYKDPDGATAVNKSERSGSAGRGLDGA